MLTEECKAARAVDIMGEGLHRGNRQRCIRRERETEGESERVIVTGMPITREREKGGGGGDERRIGTAVCMQPYV